MAKLGLYRSFYTYYWSDPWVQGLEVDEKLLFIYLFSNDRASMSGIYETTLRTISFESGIAEERVLEILNMFEADGKAIYDQEANVVWVVNMRKFHDIGPKQHKRIEDDVEQIPACKVKELYLSNTWTFPRLQKRNDFSPFAMENEHTDLTEAGDLYANVTGLMAFRPQSIDADIYRLGKIIAQHGDKAADYLKPFYKEWVSRGYQRINSNWLDWAIGGEIPNRKVEPVSKYTPVE